MVARLTSSARFAGTRSPAPPTTNTWAQANDLHSNPAPKTESKRLTKLKNGSLRPRPLLHCWRFALFLQRQGLRPFQTQLNKAGVPHQVPPNGKAIVVNIPSFELIAFEDGVPVLRSRSIVGAPWRRTPRLKTYESTVYLQPGLLVYLQDSNHREKFDQEYRALSYRSIRVQRWDRLVAFVLSMDLTNVHCLANGRRSFDAPAPPTPVTLGFLRGSRMRLGKLFNIPTSIVLDGQKTPQYQMKRHVRLRGCRIERKRIASNLRNSDYIISVIGFGPLSRSMRSHMHIVVKILDLAIRPFEHTGNIIT